jgi:hypothetical protein
VGGLGVAFAVLQQAKRGEYKINDYSIAQYSLESVFIGLAKSGDGAVCAGTTEVMGVSGGAAANNTIVDENGELVDVV